MDQALKGENKQATGRPRGGCVGNPFRFELTGGGAHDSIYGCEMLKAMN